MGDSQWGVQSCNAGAVRKARHHWQERCQTAPKHQYSSRLTATAQKDAHDTNCARSSGLRVVDAEEGACMTMHIHWERHASRSTSSV